MTKFIEQRVEVLVNEVAELKLIVHELRGKKSIESSTTNTVEDIIEFEGAKYRKVEREGRKGDIVIFRNNNTRFFTNGEPYKVEVNGCPIDNEKEAVLPLYSPGHGRTPETVDVYELIKSKPLTSNQQRAAIIEKAKQFVENIVGEYDSFYTTIGKHKNQSVTPIFHVNEKKCAVTVLIYGAFSKRLIFKGIAKCNPSDVYNEHIGKAIALGRALGLDVSEFEQALQPTTIVEGMIVHGSGCVYHTAKDKDVSVVKILNDGGYLVDAKNTYRDDKLTWVAKHQGRIINDTNAIYEEGQ